MRVPAICASAVVRGRVSDKDEASAGRNLLKQIKIGFISCKNRKSMLCRAKINQCVETRPRGNRISAISEARRKMRRPIQTPCLAVGSATQAWTHAGMAAGVLART
jgi:hypothetical protein